MTRDSARKSSMSNKASMESMANMERTERLEHTERTKIFGLPASTTRLLSIKLIAWVAAAGLAATIGLGALGGCAGSEGEDPNVSSESGTEHAGAERSESEGDSPESEGDSPESGSDDGEESGDLLALDEIYDVIRKGARLILRYDAASNAFVGTVQNSTDSVLKKVRVEVHLSDGTELGPTTPVDLDPGETIEVSLAATEEPFTGWTPHAEVGEGEHGSGGESGEGGEHGAGGEGEHGSEGDESREHGGGGEGGEGGGEHGEGGEGSEGGGEHGSGG